MFDFYVYGLSCMFWFQVGARHSKPKDEKSSNYSVLLVAIFWPFTLAYAVYLDLKRSI
jgi:hypothetical protein